MAARRVVAVAAFVVVLAVIFDGCNGLCSLKLQDMLACQPAVSTGNPTKPSSGCCKAIRGLTSDDIACLCDVKNNRPNLLRSFGVDPARCLQLPGLCDYPVAVNC